MTYPMYIDRCLTQAGHPGCADRGDHRDARLARGPGCGDRARYGHQQRSSLDRLLRRAARVTR